MVLLRGFSLEERPITPKPPPAASPGLKGIPIQGGYQIQANLQQGIQNQPTQYINQQQVSTQPWYITINTVRKVLVQNHRYFS